ncbi:MAG: hypothetical protein ACM3JG_04900 [Thiohalocapsa sp.]
MRLFVAGTLLVGLTALSGCATPFTPTAPPGPPVTLAQVDPDEAAARAVVGSAIGAGVGASLGAAFAITPWIGAAVGASTGAAVGAAIGAVTAQPVPTYAAIAVPPEPVIPNFYDTWPPGWHVPPIASQTPPPPPVLP